MIYDWHGVWSMSLSAHWMKYLIIGASVCPRYADDGRQFSLNN